jgi:hypothetical protein
MRKMDMSMMWGRGEDFMTNVFYTANKQLNQLTETLALMQAEVDERQKSILALQKQFDLLDIDADAFTSFIRKPYILKPIRGDRHELIVPRFINFQAGWPVRTEGEYVVYQVSRFIDLITPLPDWLRGELGYKKPDFNAHLEGEWLVVDNGNPDAVYDSLGRGKRFSVRDGKRLKMTARSRFDVLRDLMRLGVLPYRPQPIPERIRRSSIPGIRMAGADENNKVITLRPEQARDYQIFEKYSAVSVFATGGAGKTFFGLYAIGDLKGKKVIFAPRKSILQQWEARMQSYFPSHVLDEVELRTYQSLKNKPLNGEYSLAIFDEIQHMPADMGIRASQINAVTRIGLSATPWREDGNEDIIPALCGIPVGSDWKSGEPAETTVWLVENEAEKLDLAENLAQAETRAKTMIFVYRLEIGERIAKRLGVPFIHGGTSKQYQAIQAANTFVISKVGDAGISVDVSRVIEVDWLGGRAEAGQRALRTQHANERGELHVLMTRREYKDNAKRLSALYALNFDVKVRGS